MLFELAVGSAAVAYLFRRVQVTLDRALRRNEQRAHLGVLRLGNRPAGTKRYVREGSRVRDSASSRARSTIENRSGAARSALLGLSRMPVIS